MEENWHQLSRQSHLLSKNQNTRIQTLPYPTIQLLKVRIHIFSKALTVFQVLSATVAIFGTALAAPAKGDAAASATPVANGNKPTGGLESATITIYPGPYTYTDVNTVPPTDGTT